MQNEVVCSYLPPELGLYLDVVEGGAGLRPLGSTKTVQTYVCVFCVNAYLCEFQVTIRRRKQTQ